MMLLAAGIEVAQSLEPLAVARALESLCLREFMGEFAFGPNRQRSAASALRSITVYQGGVHLVFPPELAAPTGRALRFPAPSWTAQRHEYYARQCAKATRDSAGDTCSGHGACAGGECKVDGCVEPARVACVCDPGWTGTACDLQQGRAGGTSTAELVGFIFLACVSSALLVLAVWRRFFVKRGRGSKVEHMKLRSTGKRPELQKLGAGEFHAFLSHIWLTGQDSCALIKQQLLALLPGVCIFRDVDDLRDISQLENYVASSRCIALFLSKGYFLSRNCLREVNAAVSQAKPLVLVHEIDPHKGGTLDELRADCPAALQPEVFESGFPTIRWHRLKHLQLASLLSMASAFLRANSPELASPSSGGGAERAEGRASSALYVASAVTETPLKLGREVVLYVSQHNEGADALAQILVATASSPVTPKLPRGKQGKKLRVSSAGMRCSMGSCSRSPSMRMVASMGSSRSLATQKSTTATAPGVAGAVDASTPPSFVGAPAPAPASATATAAAVQERSDDSGRPGPLPLSAEIAPIEEAEVQIDAPERSQPTAGRLLGRLSLGGKRFRRSRSNLDNSIIGDEPNSVSSSAKTATLEGDAAADEEAPRLDIRGEVSVTPLQRFATHMLLYLARDTFTGEAGDALAEEVRAARRGGVGILMVHEQRATHCRCEFDRFFASTPDDLVRDGLFNDLAVPWHAGELEQAVAVALLYQKIAASQRTAASAGAVGVLPARLGRLSEGSRSQTRRLGLARRNLELAGQPVTPLPEKSVRQSPRRAPRVPTKQSSKADKWPINSERSSKADKSR